MYCIIFHHTKGEDIFPTFEHTHIYTPLHSLFSPLHHRPSRMQLKIKSRLYSIYFRLHFIMGMPKTIAF